MYLFSLFYTFLIKQKPSTVRIFWYLNEAAAEEKLTLKSSQIVKKIDFPLRAWHWLGRGRDRELSKLSFIQNLTLLTRCNNYSFSRLVYRRRAAFLASRFSYSCWCCLYIFTFSFQKIDCNARCVWWTFNRFALSSGLGHY